MKGHKIHHPSDQNLDGANDDNTPCSINKNLILSAQMVATETSQKGSQQTQSRQSFKAKQSPRPDLKNSALILVKEPTFGGSQSLVEKASSAVQDRQIPLYQLTTELAEEQEPCPESALMPKLLSPQKSAENQHLLRALKPTNLEQNSNIFKKSIELKNNRIILNQNTRKSQSHTKYLRRDKDCNQEINFKKAISQMTPISNPSQSNRQLLRTGPSVFEGLKRNHVNGPIFNRQQGAISNLIRFKSASKLTSQNEPELQLIVPCAGPGPAPVTDPVHVTTDYNNTTTNGNTKSFQLEGGGQTNQSNSKNVSQPQHHQSDATQSYAFPIGNAGQNAAPQTTNNAVGPAAPSSQESEKKDASQSKAQRNLAINISKITQFQNNNLAQQTYGGSATSLSHSSKQGSVIGGVQGLTGTLSLPEMPDNHGQNNSLRSNLQNRIGLKGEGSFVQSSKDGLGSNGSVGGARSNQGPATSQGSRSQRAYPYCIDTKQIMNMIDFSIQWLSVPIKEIQDATREIQTQNPRENYNYGGIQQRSKSSSESSGSKGAKVPYRQVNLDDLRQVKESRQNKSQNKDTSNYLRVPSTANRHILVSKKQNLFSARLDSMQDVKSKEQSRIDIFCGGNKDLNSLATYMNHKLVDYEQKFLIRQHNLKPASKKQGQGTSELFKKQSPKPSQKHVEKIKQVQDINFAKVFGLDDETFKNSQNFHSKLGSNTNLNISSDMTSSGLQAHSSKSAQRFTYFVQNEKILSNQMFFVESQRTNFVKQLKEIKKQLSNFIAKKYKDLVTKLGFSSEKELFNIFSKMLTYSSSKGFFNNQNVRKVLSQFWLSIREVFTNLKIRNSQAQGATQANQVYQVLNQEINKLSYHDEVILRNNFYLRLEIITRGRFIHEPCELQNYIGSGASQISQIISPDLSKSQDNISSVLNQYKIYPIHQAIFENNLRHLSKLLKLEVDGMFYNEKNQIDNCGNTPLMLAVKLGSLDAVKILTDVYTDPKLRPLQELMTAKEMAIAMKHQQILKILISANQKIKQQFFDQNKEAIFKVLERMPDFKVDLNLTCDSNWFPVFSSVAPSDTYKIYKKGSSLRLDMTLLGLQKYNLIKGNVTILYKGRGTGENEGDLLMIDHKLQTVNNIFNRCQENKINTEIQDILTGKQILKKFQTHSLITDVEKDRFGKPVSKQINDYLSEKYILKSRYTMVKYQMNLNQIDQIKGLKSFDQYMDALSIDYISLIETHLDNISYERDDQRDNQGITNLFKQKKFTQNQQISGASLTSRPNFGGTSVLDNQGMFSQRDNQHLHNLGNYNSGQQMHTQEDHTSGSNDQIYILGKQKNSTSLMSTQRQNQQRLLLQQNKQITIKKKQQKQVEANLWLCKNYPFSIEQFMPLIHVLSFCSKQIRQFNKFLLKYPMPHSQKCFPVEARIPLFMTMEAVFSFKNIEMNFQDSSVFDVDREVTIKQNENMALYAKQQISYLQMHSSLDTQEDKQAKALKEIYKLCKTDEGDQSGDIIYGDDQIVQNNRNGHNQQDGYESESSDKIKEMFNKMMTNEDGQGDNDLLLIQENDQQDTKYQQQQMLQLGLTPSQIKYDQDPQAIQSKGHSRNFANQESGFHEIKNSLTHSDLLKLRKSGNGNGRTPTKQFSIQSDITESIEVSERSFNDKLAKLQIHSFQNVKFMSQFKKNLGGPVDMMGSPRTLERYLQEQFKENQNEVYRDSQVKRISNLEEFQQRAQKINNIANITKKDHRITGGLHSKVNMKAPAHIRGSPEEEIKEMAKGEHFMGQRFSQRDCHLKNISHMSQHSYMSSINNGENIYDSKLNEERPKINKSLGKHQINNNLHMWTKKGEKIYKDYQPHINSSNAVYVPGLGSVVSSRPPLQFQRDSENGQPIGHRIQNVNSNIKYGAGNSQSSMTIQSGTTIQQDFQPRDIPRQKITNNNFNNANNQLNQVLSPGMSQIDNNLEDGSVTGSSTHGLLQSMTSLNGQNVFAINSEMGSAGQSGRSTANEFTSRAGGKSSTADSSVLKMANSNTVVKQGNYLQKANAAKNQPSILDKNKLKLILGNLRNDNSAQNKNMAKPRYLNTIESEGNLQSQHFNKNENRQSLISRASGNQLSQRSIHSLESLKSEGSQEKIQEETKQVIERSERRKAHRGIADSNHSQMLQQERSQHVPMHTGDNGSQGSHDHSEQIEPVSHSAALFSFEKNHRQVGLDNVDSSEPAPVRFSQGSINKDRPRKQEQHPANPQLQNQQLSQQQQQALKLNFFQKMQNFIQDSITERKNQSPVKLGQYRSNSPNKLTNLKQEMEDRQSNEDNLFRNQFEAKEEHGRQSYGRKLQKEQENFSADRVKKQNLFQL